jgi:NAD(P)-dependent dehydrogenase (short-subunit alcohol dehydrogenase family)
VYELEGKIAIVTGAARGLGLRFAQRLAGEGVKVALADRDLGAAESAAAAIGDDGGTAIAVSVDVVDPAQTEAMAAAVREAFGGVDILVNHAATSDVAVPDGIGDNVLVELPLDRWKHAIAVNLTGVLLCARAVTPLMRERGGGKIVNRSSPAADQPRDERSITNLGAQGITVSLARSLAQYGITVNCIVPGLTTAAQVDDAELESAVSARQLLSRPGTPDDPANVLLWLVSGQTDFITGQLIRVDGGYVIHPG